MPNGEAAAADVKALFKDLFVLAVLAPYSRKDEVLRVFDGVFVKAPGWRKQCRAAARVVAAAAWSGNHAGGRMNDYRTPLGLNGAPDLMCRITRHVGLERLGHVRTAATYINETRGLVTREGRGMADGGRGFVYRVALSVACVDVSDDVVTLTFLRPNCLLPGCNSPVTARPDVEWRRADVGDQLVTHDYALFSLVSALGGTHGAEGR